MTPFFLRRDIKLNISKTFVLTGVLIAYMLISLIYQSWIFFARINQFSEVETFKVSECYTLWVRLPKQVPLVSVPTIENTRPITIWGERNLEEESCQEKPKQLQVDFLDGQKLGFLEIENPSPDASVWLTFGDNSAEGDREQLFIYAPLSKDVPDGIALKIRVHLFDFDSEAEKEWEASTSLSMQSFSQARYMRLISVVFGIPTITLLVALGSIVKIYLDWRDKREQERKELQDKREQDIDEFQKEVKKLDERQEYLGECIVELTSKAQLLGEGYPEILVTQFKRLKNSMQGNDIWNKSLRQKIIVMIEQKDSTFLKQLQKWNSILGFPRKDNLLILEKFYNWSCKNIVPSIEDENLKNALNVFRFLGMGSEKLIVDKMKEFFDNSDAENLEQTQIEVLHRFWYGKEKENNVKEGRASRRYLLNRLGNELKISELTEKVVDWQKQKPTPPNHLKEAYQLWPSSLRFRVQGGSQSDLWQQPFGPLKAENDPRLPSANYKNGDKGAKASSFFFSAEDFDWGKSIANPEDGLYYSEKGMGKTTFIWMGRHQRRYWGAKPSLSVYLSLTGIVKSEKLWWQVERALGDSLLVNLVEDPYWLLDASSKTQERIGAFLIYWAGGFSSLLTMLAEAGFPEDDQVIIIDTLYYALSAENYQRFEFQELIARVLASMSEGADLRLAPGESFELFWWVELKNLASTQEWLKIIDKEGLATLGIIKIFANMSPDLNEIPGFKNLNPYPISWDDNSLEMLLERRLDGCQWTSEPGKWNRRMKEKEKLVTKEELLKRAHNSPRELIRLGNEILFHV